MFLYLNHADTNQKVLLGQKEAMARIRGGLRRDGLNDLMFVNNLIQKDLSISILFVLLVMFSIFCNLSTIHNLATYTLKNAQMSKS